MEKKRFVHIRLVPGNGGGVVTAAIGDEIRDHRVRIIPMAFSFCSPKDQWNRKYGNALADFRLERGEVCYVIVSSDDDGTLEEIVDYTIMNERIKCPRWVRDVNRETICALKDTGLSV